MSLSNSPLRSPLNFEVTCLEDLLIWADLWIDYNEPLYADACRWAYKKHRWPRGYRISKKDKVQYRWAVRQGTNNRHFTERKYLLLSASNFPCDTKSNTSRSYFSITCAFLDLFNHMIMDPKVFLRELESPSPS